MPQQAAAELGFFEQYGLSSILFVWGLPAKIRTHHRYIAVRWLHGSVYLGRVSLKGSVVRAYRPDGFCRYRWSVHTSISNRRVFTTGVCDRGAHENRRGVHGGFFDIDSMEPHTFWLWAPETFSAVRTSPNELAESSWHQIAVQAPVTPSSAIAMSLTYTGLLLMLLISANVITDQSKANGSI